MRRLLNAAPALAAIAFFLSSPVKALDPALVNLIGPDARVLAGVNLEQARGTPFGRFLLDQVKGEDKDFQQFIAATGFDVRRDLREVLLASPGGDNRGLVIVAGSFDTARIMDYGRAHGGVVTSYQGVDVLEGGQKQPGWVAFPDGSTAIAGDAASVRAALDRRKSGAGPDARLAAAARSLGAANDAWIATLGPPSDLAARVSTPKSDLAQAILQVSAGLKLDAGLLISGEAVTRSEKDAMALADVAHFLAGMAQLNREKEGAGNVASALDKLELTTEANTLKFSLKLAEADIESLIKSKSNHPHVHKGAGRARTI